MTFETLVVLARGPEDYNRWYERHGQRLRNILIFRASSPEDLEGLDGSAFYTLLPFWDETIENRNLHGSLINEYRYVPAESIEQALEVRARKDRRP